MTQLPTTIKKFTHSGKNFSIKIFHDHEGWHLKVFEGDKPLNITTDASDEVVQDARVYKIDDIFPMLADDMKRWVKEFIK